MSEAIQYDGRWWSRSGDGQWLCWSDERQAWEPSPDFRQSQAVAAPGSAPQSQASAQVQTQPFAGYQFPSAHAVVAGVRPAGSGPSLAFQPLTALCGWAVGLLAAAVLIDVIAVAAGLAEIGLLRRIADGGVWTMAEADANDARVAAVALLQLLLLLSAGIVFIVWFHRAYRNMHGALGPPPRFSHGWAAGSWFVPFLNLIRPKQIADELWQSARVAGMGSTGGRREGEGAPGWLHLWWALWLLANVLYQIGVALLGDGQATGALIAGSQITAVADLCSVAAGCLAMRFVREVTHGQRRRAAVLRSQGWS